jgi:hypothetical protein
VILLTIVSESQFQEWGSGSRPASSKTPQPALIARSGRVRQDNGRKRSQSRLFRR